MDRAASLLLTASRLCAVGAMHLNGGASTARAPTRVEPHDPDDDEGNPPRGASVLFPDEVLTEEALAMIATRQEPEKDEQDEPPLVGSVAARSAAFSAKL